MTNILLFGFKSCGKSFWARRLAQERGYCYVDTDLLLEEHHQLPCPEIYRLVGEEQFRHLEHQILERLKGKTQCVIALGGGTPLSEKNLHLLYELGQLVYLKVGKELLKERLRGKARPTFFSEKEFEPSFEKVYRERLPIYESIKAYRVDLSESEEKIETQFKKVFDGQ